MAHPGSSAANDYLEHMADWLASLPVVSLRDLLAAHGGPGAAAVFCVDMTRGFCTEGRLASPRVASIVPAVARLLVRSYEAGVRRFYLPQDRHAPDAAEFDQYGAHCVAGTTEADLVPELAGLPFADTFVVIPKDTVASHVATDLDARLDRDGWPGLCIVVGDCTDICVYQLAIHLKARANAQRAGTAVVVPEVCVQTYDLPLTTALDAGAVPHDGDLLHRVFLHHMALNGVLVVSEVVP